MRALPSMCLCPTLINQQNSIKRSQYARENPNPFRGFFRLQLNLMNRTPKSEHHSQIAENPRMPTNTSRPQHARLGPAGLDSRGCWRRRAGGRSFQERGENSNNMGAGGGGGQKKAMRRLPNMYNGRTIRRSLLWLCIRFFHVRAEKS